MDLAKATYASVARNAFPVLNPKLSATPLIPKPVKARLSEKAKRNLRSIIRGDPTSPENSRECVVYNQQPEPKPVTNYSRPLV